ncbi:MAG: hypothetical protein CSB55_01445 [Candidatus Cloacimonadota bacterium]|nr:MAG: hypothetical protein CSB55_01445 [Candidatus Cloacimonadota bacterium]
MKKIRIIFYAITFLLFLSCAKSNNPELLTENISLNIPLKNAYQAGYDIDRISATIFKDAFSESINLLIEDSIATGSFLNLEPDTYEIEVSAFDAENNLLAFGEGEVTVIAGQTAECHITLHFDELTGDVNIIVHFDFPDRWDSVLFIGNSYTYANSGLDTHLENMMREYENSDNFTASRVTYGGYTLEDHFNNPNTIEAIESGNWDLVILQEQSMRPIMNKRLMFKYATKLDSVITENGEDTGFFMTWAREYNQAMTESLSQAYIEIADSLNAALAPVGLAFSEVYANTNINIYSNDGSHPSPQGTYLAACMFFCLITDNSPEGLIYDMNGSIDETEKNQLQTMAWDVYQENKEARALLHN